MDITHWVKDYEMNNIFIFSFSNSMFGKESFAIELLKSDPPRSALKGGREKQKNKVNNCEPVVNNDTESDKDSEDEEPDSPQPEKTTVTLKTNISTEDSTNNKPSVKVSRFGPNRDDNKDTKSETITATLGKSGVGISRISRDTAEKEPEPVKSRFQLPSRTGVGRLSGLDNKTEEKKPEETTRTSLSNRYSNRFSTRDEKDEDSTTNRFRRIPKPDDDNRTRKKDVSFGLCYFFRLLFKI